MCLAVFLSLGGAGAARAYDLYLIDFNTRYGTSGTVLDSCIVCHFSSAGAGATNPYGTDYGSSNHNFAAIEPLDSDRDDYTNIIEIHARTLPGDANSHPWTPKAIPPVVTAFTIPATYNSLVVPITVFTAIDNAGVTGYMATQTATTPSPTAQGWSATPPASFTFLAPGVKILYGWARNAAESVSLPMHDAVTITLNDTTRPVVTTFLIPPISNSLVVPVTTFTATDDQVVTGYKITQSPAKPGWGALGWSPAPPTSFTFMVPGVHTLYGYARDGAGHVSPGLSAKVAITLNDIAPPVVTSFTAPAAPVSRTVPISTFIATDNQVVTGYKITQSPAKPGWGALGWSPAPPTSFTFMVPGVHRLYGYARDGAGNVSKGVLATVTVP